MSTETPARTTSSMRTRSSGRETVPLASRPTSTTVVQAAGSCSTVAAMTMPETWVWGLSVTNARSSGRPWPSSQRAGASRPSVRTSESSTSRTAGVGKHSMPSRTRAQHRLAAGALGREPLAPGTVTEPAHVGQPAGPGPLLLAPGVAEDADGEVGRDRSGSRPGTSRLRATASASARSPTMPTTPASVSSTSTGAAGQHGLLDDLLDVVAGALDVGRVDGRLPAHVADAGVQGEEVARARRGAATASSWAARRGAAYGRGRARAPGAGRARRRRPRRGRP